MPVNNLANTGTDDAERFFYEPLWRTSPNDCVDIVVEHTDVDRCSVASVADLDIDRLNNGVMPAIPKHSFSIEPRWPQELVDNLNERFYRHGGRYFPGS